MRNLKQMRGKQRVLKFKHAHQSLSHRPSTISVEFVSSPSTLFLIARLGHHGRLTTVGIGDLRRKASSVSSL